MTNYSGRVTADHPYPSDQKHPNPPAALKLMWVFDVQWSDCPVEVEDDVRRLWQDHELSNDVCFVKWKKGDFQDEEGGAEQYPALAAYLAEKNVAQCWIHWWW